MRLCPKCRLDYMVPDYYEGVLGEEFVRYTCFECGYSFIETFDPEMEDWTKNEYDLIEGDELG